MNRLRPLMPQRERSHDEEPMIEPCVGISSGNFPKKNFDQIFEYFLRLVPAPKSDDLAQVYDEKLRLLRKLKPGYFDSQGNLLSYNTAQTHSQSVRSAPSSKK